jgi:hypothetical protein
MTVRRKPRPRDPVQLGKLIVEIATGQIEDREDNGKDPNAAALGHKGGAARAEKLTAEQRAEIARRGAANAKAKLLRPTRPEQDDPNIAAASGAAPAPTGLSEGMTALRLRHGGGGEGTAATVAAAGRLGQLGGGMTPGQEEEAVLLMRLADARETLRRVVEKTGLEPGLAAATCAELAGEYAALLAVERDLPPRPGAGRGGTGAAPAWGGSAPCAPARREGRTRASVALTRPDSGLRR